MIKTLKLNLFWRELVLFGLTQVLGIVVAERYLFGLAGSSLRAPEVAFKFSGADWILSALVVALFVWAVLNKHRASRIIFKVFFWLVIIGGAQIIFSVWFPPLCALLMTIGLIVLMLKSRSVLIQNLAVLLAMAGMGVVLGLSISPLIAVWGLLILSFYDIIAVYVTKHMVKMAKGMAESGAVFGFIVPFEWSGFREHVKKAKREKFMILGSGDIALPLVMAVSAMSISVAHAWIVALFSMIGLFLTHLLFVNQSQRRPMAALPPIAMMAIVGYLVALILPF